MGDDKYIAVQAEHGKFVAIHHPNGMRRHFMYEEDLQALKLQWGIDTVIGDDLLKVKPRPSVA